MRTQVTDLHGPADGETFDPNQDQNRLNLQRQRVFALMNDHEWHPSTEFERRLGDSWASLSARVRDLRKPKFGGHTVERRRVTGVPGLHEYRLVPDDPNAKLINMLEEMRKRRL